VISEEHDHFFSRPALMYVFCGQLTLQGTEPYDRGLYQRLGLERRRERVSSLDPGRKELVFAEGGRLGYDRLLVAVGSKARPAPWPGSAGPGMHGFVTLRNLEGLDREARPGLRAAVIGGGLIGVEVAEILMKRGLGVTFIVRESWYFPLALDRSEAELVAEHMRGHGCDVRLGVNVEEVLRRPDGRVRGLGLSPAPGAQPPAGNSEIACDLVVAAIGVVPNTDFLRESGLALGKGGAIEADPALRTNVADVWAAGDCANVTWADGSRRPEQLWYTARDQGRIAGASMLGDEVAYSRGTWYNSAKFFDLEYTTAGWVPVTLDWDNTPLDPGSDVRSWFQRAPGRPESQRIVVKGDRVVGFNMLGSRWNHELFLEWIRERRSLDWVLARLHHAQFDEEFARRFQVAGGGPRSEA